MRYCPECTAMNESEADACWYCGAHLEREDEET